MAFQFLKDHLRMPDRDLIDVETRIGNKLGTSVKLKFRNNSRAQAASSTTFSSREKGAWVNNRWLSLQPLTRAIATDRCNIQKCAVEIISRLADEGELPFAAKDLKKN